MDTYEKVAVLSRSLERFAEKLEIPESRYLEAQKRYEAVGTWLGKEDSALSKYAPEIYPQGSFSLGTVVKPISNRDEYDVDLVCYLAKLNEKDTAQGELKKIVGNRLRENETYKGLLDQEGRRCWTLNYANEFHLDILPAIADDAFRARGGLYADAILITDKMNIERNELDWPKSNPKGYTKWFQSRQERVFAAFRKSMAESAKLNMDDIPSYKIKTPLQRAIQILKRHRDIYFAKKDAQNKPISIIITTLSAMLYNGQDNDYNAIYDVLLKIDDNMVKRDGKYSVPNPVNVSENFADKWNENPDLPQAFFDWIKEAKSTFCSSELVKSNSMEASHVLEEALGVKAPEEADLLAKSPLYVPPYVKRSPSQERSPWADL